MIPSFPPPPPPKLKKIFGNIFCEELQMICWRVACGLETRVPLSLLYITFQCQNIGPHKAGWRVQSPTPNSTSHSLNSQSLAWFLMVPIHLPAPTAREWFFLMRVLDIIISDTHITTKTTEVFLVVYYVHVTWVRTSSPGLTWSCLKLYSLSLNSSPERNIPISLRWIIMQ